MNAADVAQSAVPSFAPSLSIWFLFWQAHFVVKLVMIGLLVASIWCWAIIFNKVLLYKRLAKAMDRFEDVFWSGQSLDELYRTLSETQPAGMGAVFLAAMTEWKRSLEGSGRAFGSLAGRVEKVMDVAIQRETERLNGGLMVLSNIASAGPFIGLFGTVWGIMNSFMAIAASKNTSLAVVAPGISESLLATAIGLVAAIPAVIAYNSFAARVANLQTRLEGFADEFSAILSRQVDQRLAA
jgi:biopolymer transport protein TolQ